MEVSRNAEQKSVQALLERLLFLFGGKEHFVRITNRGCFSRAENGSCSEGRFVLRVWIIWFRFFFPPPFFFSFAVEAWRWLNVLSAGNYQEIWVFSWISLRWYTALGVIQENSVTRQSFCGDTLSLSQSFKVLHQQAFYFLFLGFHLRNWNNSLIPFRSFLRWKLFSRQFYRAHFPTGLLPLASAGKALGSFSQDFL